MSHHATMQYRVPLIRSRQTTRAFSRHRVEIPCELVTSDDDAPLLHWASDMSGSGVWFDTMRPRAVGDEVVVCFKPPTWWRAPEISVFGSVTRISRGLREEDEGPGMGIAFLDLTRHERFNLRKWLRPRPQREPTRRVPRRVDDVSIRAAALSPFARRIN